MKNWVMNLLVLLVCFSFLFSNATAQTIPLVNADFTADDWTNEETFIQNTGVSTENMTGWTTEGLIRGYNLDVDGDGDPTMNSGDQVRIWAGWMEGDGLRQVGFQAFQDPVNSISQDAGMFEEGTEYTLSVQTGPGFEGALQQGFIQIRRASDDTLLNETTFLFDLTGNDMDVSSTQTVSHTATASDAGSAIRVRIGTLMELASGTAVIGPVELSGDGKSFLLGDVNCDGAVDLLDVAPFIDLLTNGGFSVKADINQDGAVDLLDVQPFVDLLTGG